MSVSLKKSRTFGRCDRDVAWSRVLRAQCKLRPSASRIGLVMSFLAVSGFLMALDATALAFSEGYRGLWVLPRGMEPMLTTVSPAIGTSLMFILMLVCFQSIVRLVAMFRSDEPIIMADFNSLVVRTRSGPAGFAWSDIEEVRDLPGMMMIRVRDGFVFMANEDGKRPPRTIWIPTLFLEGGAQGLMNAIAHVRPDLVRHWWPEAPLPTEEEKEENLAMVGFGGFGRKKEEEPKLKIRGQSATPIRLTRS